MVDYGHQFWTGESEYQELAKEFEQNIEITHPDITTNYCHCSKWVKHCTWAVTDIKYFEYRGESI